MLGPLIYSLIRLLLDVFATSHGDQVKLQADALALRPPGSGSELHIKRLRWAEGDRMVMAALREHIAHSAWAGLLVKPETRLGWPRALVRRKWAAYRGCPQRGRPRIPAECRELIIRMARENPGWGYFQIRGALLKLGRTVGATTIRAVLIAAGIPTSGRRATLSWTSIAVVNGLSYPYDEEHKQKHGNGRENHANRDPADCMFCDGQRRNIGL